jgi:hypothetical protein
MRPYAPRYYATPVTSYGAFAGCCVPYRASRGALETGGVRVASMAAALLAALAAVSYLQALEGIRRAAQLVA